MWAMVTKVVHPCPIRNANLINELHRTSSNDDNELKKVYRCYRENDINGGWLGFKISQIFSGISLSDCDVHRLARTPVGVNTYDSCTCQLQGFPKTNICLKKCITREKII